MSNQRNAHTVTALRDCKSPHNHLMSFFRLRVSGTTPQGDENLATSTRNETYDMRHMSRHLRRHHRLLHSIRRFGCRNLRRENRLHAMLMEFLRLRRLLLLTLLKSRFIFFSKICKGISPCPGILIVGSRTRRRRCCRCCG